MMMIWVNWNDLTVLRNLGIMIRWKSSPSNGRKIQVSDLLSKEVWRRNFRQYGQMEKHHSSVEDQTRRRSERETVKSEEEKMQVREKVGKSRNTVFFQCFVAPEGRKVGSLKQRVRRHLGR